MKKLLYLLPLSLFFLSSSCGDDEGPVTGTTTNLNITFKAVYDGQPLVFGESLTYTDGTAFNISKLQFFMSNANLISPNEADPNTPLETELSEVKLVDFSSANATAAGATEGVTITYTRIPTGEYNAFKFGLGVIPEYNDDVPADYSSSHPLGAPSNYWEVWESYIFVKLEGRTDTTGNGEFDQSLLYHTGTNALFQEGLNFSKAMTLVEDNEANMTIELDVKEILAPTGGTPINIINDGFSHTNPEIDGQVALSTTVMQNFKNAFTLVD